MTPAGRAVRRAAAALTLVLGASAAAGAQTIPVGASIASDRSVDLAGFSGAVASRYHAVFQKLVATDIDRDGDDDVIGAGDPGLMVWLNDGVGHLTFQVRLDPPARTIEADTPVSEWRHRSERPDRSLQDDVPSPQLPPHPGQITSAVTGAVPFAAVPGIDLDGVHDGGAPRAPPLLVG